MNLPRKQRQTHRENRPVTAEGEAGEGEKGLGFGVRRCKLVHTGGKHGPAEQQRELCSISWDKPQWKRV